MPKGNNSGRYERIFLQLDELLIKTPDPVSRMATISAILYHKMDHAFWCGFYRIVGNDLIVGPYQGPVACQLLEKNKGVCWAAINENRTMVVPDVHKFPGHIACDARSQSEIVVPVRQTDGLIIAVLDIDSKELNSFTSRDAEYLEKIVELVCR